MTLPKHSDAERLIQLNAKVQRGSLRGAWQRDRSHPGQVSIKPRVWRWNDMAPLDEVMRMRTLHMTNSPETIPLGAARTFAAMLQHVNGGEVTESHRHTATSIYFAIQGGGIYTTAEGEQQYMEPGDLLTQPGWTWHGTTNLGSDPAIWFTAMDTSLMQFLDNWENQRYPDSLSQPITKPDGFHMKCLGPLRTRGELEGNGPFPMKYRWSETWSALQALAAAAVIDPFDGAVLEYRNPQDGGPTTATLSCRIQLLGPGKQTRSHRHTSNTVYHVVRGRGVARIGKTRTDEMDLTWSERDCFNVPTWHWHRFVNSSSSEDLILFSVSDRPLFDALRLYREDD